MLNFYFPRAEYDAARWSLRLAAPRPARCAGIRSRAFFHDLSCEPRGAGFAARPLLENLAAGVQIALTQPIRIDDVVVVENQTGRIEKNCGNLCLQNLTYTTADLLGTIVLKIEAAFPLEHLRSELRRILEKSSLWDGQKRAQF